MDTELFDEVDSASGGEELILDIEETAAETETSETIEVVADTDSVSSDSSSDFTTFQWSVIVLLVLILFFIMRLSFRRV